LGVGARAGVGVCGGAEDEPVGAPSECSHRAEAAGDVVKHAEAVGSDEDPGGGVERAGELKVCVRGAERRKNAACRFHDEGRARVMIPRTRVVLEGGRFDPIHDPGEIEGFSGSSGRPGGCDGVWIAVQRMGGG
jgi:hypothetical protein